MAEYTNILGSSLEQSVLNQLQQRALRLSQAGVRDGGDIRALGNKNCWVRLTSFVNLLDGAVTELKKVVDREVSIEGGTRLAEQWVLKSEQRNGTEFKYGIGSSGAYGSGGVSELGYRPMPGIYSITVESQPPTGAIRIATVKMKAWNMNQLSMIDVLYFRLNFSMLLEWGHSVFTDNKGRLVNGATPINAFKSGITKEDILKELGKKRKEYSHNYEGMLGLVTNYEWVQEQDGSYDCTLKLCGIGSIIESLKINGQDGMSDVKVGDSNTNNNKPGLSQIVTGNDSALTYFITSIASAFANEMSTKEYWNKLFSGGLDLIASPSPGFKAGYSTKYMSNDIPDDGTFPLADMDKLRYFSKLSIIQLQADNTKSKSSDARFITLAALIAFINNSCLIYDRVKGSEVSPAIHIDFNQNTNYCLRMTQQFSVDPGVCLVETDCKQEDYEKLFTVKGVKPEQVTGTKSVPGSGNLKVGGGYIDSSNPQRGKFMNILVNVECIKTVIAENTDNEKNLFLSRFLSELMKKIQVALGNINSFKIGYDETANTVYIYDDQLVALNNRTQPIPTLPVFGLTSTVREFSLKSEASSKLGSLMAINARAGAVNTGTNQDSSAFTALNQGLEDRLLRNVSKNPKKEEEGTPQPPPPADVAEGLVVLANGFNTQIGKLYEIGSQNVSYDVAAVDSVKNYYIDAMLRLKGEILEGEDTDSVAATGILPLALNITLDGIGGVPLYQAFTIPANRLPAQYIKDGKPRIGFTISGTSHTVDKNQWTTAIRGLMINIPKRREVYTPNYVAKLN